MGKLIAIRHGQSTWNAENRFTGWVDVDLSEKGVLEAEKSGRLLKDLNLKYDICFTSCLKRAIKTLEIVLKIVDKDSKYTKAWELNERHYGALTGLNKTETKKKLGEKQFNQYRRSWDNPPPILEKESKYSSHNDSFLYKKLKSVPNTESLKDTYNRVIPFYEKEIKKYIKENKNVLIAAHGNSLRALCKYLFKISDNKINELEIPTGNPLVIEFKNSDLIKRCYYLDKTRSKNIIFNQ
jgi:2,3-bisphosphoglycerate-dependent phosphoglycerate mutase